MTNVLHTPEPWKVSHTAQRQSNYGRYKAGLHRGKGMELETVSITADTPERALKIARDAAAAPDMLAALCQVDAFFTAQGKHIDDYIGSVHTHPIVKAAIAKAKEE